MFVYDVYLKKRLTEIDAIITQLVQRDSFSMYDLLNIYCSMGDIEIQKNFNIESTAFFDATLNDILKIVHEQIENNMYISIDTDLLNGIVAECEVKMILWASEIDTLECDFTGGESRLEIFTDPLDYYVAYSLGKNEFKTLMDSVELDTFKYSMEKILNNLYLLEDAVFSSIKNADTDSFDMCLDVDPTNIFYLLTIGGRSNTYLGVSPIDEYVLKKILYGLDLESYLSANTDVDWQLKKFIEVESSLYMLANIAEVLIQLISSQSEMYLDCEASAGLKRYRLLEEMDDHSLSDFDNMTLEEVDYVILAE